MKKQSYQKLVVMVVSLVLMVLVSLVGWRVVLPSGVFTTPLAGIISLAAVLTVGTGAAVVVTVIGLVVMFLLGTADWVTCFDILVTVLVVGRVINWRIPLTEKVATQQLILLGIIAGICQVVVIELAMFAAGWLFNGQLATGWAFVRLAFPLGILTALVYAVCLWPVGVGGRWLARKIK